MYRKQFPRITAITYIVGAAFGLIISVGGLIGIWTTKPRVSEGIMGTVALIGQALEATNQTLLVVVHSLDQASTSLDLINKLLDDTANSLNESQSMVNDTATMVGVDMVNIVEQTQTSLESAGSNLKVVDDTLRLISNIPFIGANYKPAVPLQESFQNVSTSLDPLPESFNTIRQKLNNSAANIGTMEAELDTIAKQIADIQDSIGKAKEVAKEYTLIIGNLQSRSTRFEQTLPDYINVTYLGLTGLLVWMMITQVGMALHGILLMGDVGAG